MRGEGALHSEPGVALSRIVRDVARAIRSTRVSNVFALISRYVLRAFCFRPRVELTLMASSLRLFSF